MTLDKNHPIPLYYQLVELIRERIQAGELKPGNQLPSERELSEQAGISRMTARQAVAFLVREGGVVVKPGVGTFVAEPKLAHNALHLLGFTEEMMRQGGSATSRVIEQALMVSPLRVAIELNLASTDWVVKIVRLRLSAELPLVLETIFVPASLCPGLEAEDLSAQSFYLLLEQKYGLRPDRTRQTLEATVVNDYERQFFGVKAGTPMILLEGVTYLEQGRPVEYFKAVYRGDRFKFELESQRQAMGVSEILGASRVSVVLA